MTTANQQEIAKVSTTLKQRIALKPTTVEGYARALLTFCRATQTDPFNDFTVSNLETIEDRTETYIMSQLDVKAPKYLNLLYNAIKAWCYANKVIRSRKMFKEIKFDKTSRKNDSMSEQAIETQQIKQLAQTRDAYEMMLIDLLGLNGLRPAILPQLKVCDLDPLSYKIDSNGKIEFTVKNPFLMINKSYEGNKAHITFAVLLHSKCTEHLAYTLNQQTDPITPNTPILQKYDTENAIYNKSKEMLCSVGFTGRPYALRSWFDRMCDKTITNDDFKETMMMHKGKISAQYSRRALTEEDRQQFRKWYMPFETWVNENVFSARTNDELAKAQAMASLAVQLGVTDKQLEGIKKLFEEGKMTLAEFEQQVKTCANDALDKRLEAKASEVFTRMAKQQQQGGEKTQ